MGVGTIGRNCGFSEQIDANAKNENLRIKLRFTLRSHAVPWVKVG